MHEYSDTFAAQQVSLSLLEQAPNVCWRQLEQELLTLQSHSGSPPPCIVRPPTAGWQAPALQTLRLPCFERKSALTLAASNKRHRWISGSYAPATRNAVGHDYHFNTITDRRWCQKWTHLTVRVFLQLFSCNCLILQPTVSLLSAVWHTDTPDVFCIFKTQSIADQMPHTNTYLKYLTSAVR